MSEFRYESTIPVPADALFDWHAREGAFERLAPPWDDIEVVRREGSIQPGDELEMALKVGPFSVRWLARHGDYEEGHHFTDEQVKGPFAAWRHTHIMEPRGEALSALRDEVEYRLPMGALGRLFGGRMTRRKLQAMFALRHDRTRWDLERHHAVAHLGAKTVAVTGASGLIGQALCAFLSTGGHRVLRLVRRPPEGEDEIAWSPAEGTLNPADLEGVDAVIHLAGENVAGGRWTDARKKAIFESRRAGTALLAEALASLERPPEVFISASAVGYYGDRGDAALDEQSASGDDFLAEVCQAWEASADPAREAGIRVVHPRIGVVLTSAGGALERMLTPFRMGVGGPIGGGEQYLSWIAFEDAIGALHHLLFNPRAEGAVNLTAPKPVPQRDFAKTLGRVLRRPAFMPLPAFVVKALFGEMGEAVLLGGQRAMPSELRELGYDFLFPELEPAIRWELGR